MRKGAIFAVTVLLLAPGQAWAGANGIPAPHFDSNAFCQAKASRFSNNADILRLCLEEEKVTGDAVKQRAVLPKFHEPCVQAAELAGGSYVVLELCAARLDASVQASSPSSAPQAEAAVSALPRYDVKAYCADVAETAGGSAMIEKSCRDMEVDALTELQGMEIPDKMLRYCDRVARTGGGSYTLLKSCVDMEMEAQKQL